MRFLLYNSFRAFDKAEYVAYLVAHRNLVFNFLQGILYAEITLVNQAIGIDDVPQYTFCNLVLMLQYGCVDSVVFGRIAVHDDIGWNILCDTAAGLNQHPASDVAGLVQDDVAAQDGAVVYLALTGYGSFDTQNTMIAYLYVVAEVYAIHQIVIIADTGTLAGIGSAADNHIFADVIVVTDYQLAFFTCLMKVLRFTAQHRAVVHFVIITHAGAFKNLRT